jgi:hypothetical protein
MPMVAPRRPLRWLLPAVTAAVLAGCVTTGPESDGPPAARSAPAQAAAPAAAPAGPQPPAAKPQVPPDFRSAVRGSRRPPPLPPSRPAFPRVSPAAVPGIALGRALSLFGKPAAVDRGAEVTTWVYRSGYCRLEIDFHFSVADNAMRAHAYRIAGGPDGRDAASRPRLCLHTLAKRSPRLADSRGG